MRARWYFRVVARQQFYWESYAVCCFFFLFGSNAGWRERVVVPIISIISSNDDHKQLCLLLFSTLFPPFDLRPSTFDLRTRSPAFFFSFGFWVVYQYLYQYQYQYHHSSIFLVVDGGWPDHLIRYDTK